MTVQPHFQSLSSSQGRQFEQQCRLVIRSQGLLVSDSPFAVPELGIEIDGEITAASGNRYWAEFKGSWQGSTPGLRRTDTVKKALANVFLAHVATGRYPPVVILTSHLPQAGSRGAVMLQVALESGALRDVININDPAAVGRLRQLA